MRFTVLSVLNLLPTKNAKMDTKHCILGNKGTLREKCFKVQKNHKAKNTKTRVIAETHE